MAFLILGLLSVNPHTRQDPDPAGKPRATLNISRNSFKRDILIVMDPKYSCRNSNHRISIFFLAARV